MKYECPKCKAVYGGEGDGITVRRYCDRCAQQQVQEIAEKRAAEKKAAELAAKRVEDARRAADRKWLKEMIAQPPVENPPVLPPGWTIGEEPATKRPPEITTCEICGRDLGDRRGKQHTTCKKCRLKYTDETTGMMIIPAVEVEKIEERRRETGRPPATL